MSKQFEQRPSGLITPVDPAEPPPRPEHPARKIIRDAMADLHEKLSHFEQTTHGTLGCCIEDVGPALVRCYNDPRAYTISDLAQIAQHVSKEEPRGNQ